MLHRAVDFRAFRNQRIAHNSALGDVVRRKARILGVDAPLLIVQVNRHGHAEQVHVRFPQGLNRADVLPVALEVVCHHNLLVVQHRGDDVLAEVVGGCLVCLVRGQVRAELRPREDVNAHGRLVGLGLLGLFFKFNNVVVRVRIHDAEAARFFPRHRAHSNRRIRAFADVVLQHGVVVHLINMVAGKNQDVIRVILLDKRHVLIDGVCRAAIPVARLARLIGRQNEHAAGGQVQIPRCAGADIGIQFQRHILRQHAHGVNAAVGAVGQREVNDAVLAAVGNSRLCHLLSQDTQTAALSACQQHGNTGLLFHDENTLLHPCFLRSAPTVQDSRRPRCIRWHGDVCETALSLLP